MPLPGNAMMPLPGNAMTPFGRRLRSSSLRRKRCGATVAVPVRLADDLVDAASVSPVGRDLLDAGAPAMDEDHVGILGAGHVEPRDDR